MKAPMYVRALSSEERVTIEAGLRSSGGFTLRRSQILLASSREERPKEIAHHLNCATQTVRNAIHGFEQKRAIVEPARLLSTSELRQRVCDYFGCEQVDLLSQKVA